MVRGRDGPDTIRLNVRVWYSKSTWRSRVGVRYSTSTVIRVSYSATPRANTLAKLGPINRQIIAVLTLRALSNSACVSIVASSRCNIIKVCVYLSIDIRSSLRLRSGVFGIQRSILSLVTVAVRQYNGARRK